MPLPALPAGLQAAADQLVDDLAGALAGPQATYLAAKGRYWQGLATHAAPPADNAALAPDKSRKPSDQAEDWTAAGVAVPVGNDGGAMRAALAVDVYDGPQGRGYAVRGVVVIAGETWQRVRWVANPEGRLDRDWARVVS